MQVWLKMAEKSEFGGFLRYYTTKMAIKQGVAPCFVLVLSTLILGVHFTLCGCKKRAVPEGDVLPVVHTNRMEDAEYVKALQANRLAQGVLTSERQDVVNKMEVLLAKARAKLPEGADDEAVKAGLAKDPVWQALAAENLRKIAAIEEKLKEARETVRERLLREQSDAKAVAEGRARPQEKLVLPSFAESGKE